MNSSPITGLAASIDCRISAARNPLTIIEGLSDRY
jgi:hypothetical protein